MPLARKRPEDKSETWRPKRSVLCYLDDVDEIVAVLSSIGPVVAETTDFSGDIVRADDLRVVKSPRLANLDLVCRDGDRSISVRLAGDCETRLVPRDDLEVVGAANRVQEIIDRRQVPWGGFNIGKAQNAMVVVAGAASLAAGTAAAGIGESASGSSSDDPPTWVFAAAFAALFAAAIVASFVLRNPRPSGQVVLAFRSDAPTWWERNQGAVLVGLVTNALVGLGFFLLGLWVGD